MFRGKTVEKVVGDVTGTIDGIGERRQAKRELEDAPLAAQRRLNERDQDKSFFYSGWRPALAWMLVLGFGWTLFGLPFVKYFYPEFPELDIARILGTLSVLLGAKVGVRQWDKHFGTDTKRSFFRRKRR